VGEQEVRTALGCLLTQCLTVIMTEKQMWIGGQLTQQGVPPIHAVVDHTKSVISTYGAHLALYWVSL